MAMDARTVEKYRKRVLEDRARLEADRAALRQRDPGDIQSELSELTDTDFNHPGDNATETMEREKDRALGENIHALLSQIDDALARMDAGTYGVCDNCRKPIGEARLEALPYATLCIECANRIEETQ